MKIDSELAMQQFAQQLASVIEDEAFILFLSGPLGVGKTTLVRGLLQAFAYSGTVKSPTFTLVEPYSLTRGELYHFDLYRLEQSQELELLGIRDYFSADASCIIEWPEKADNFLPTPDLHIHIQFEDVTRLVDIQAMTAKGRSILNKITLQ